METKNINQEQTEQITLTGRTIEAKLGESLECSVGDVLVVDGNKDDYSYSDGIVISKEGDEIEIVSMSYKGHLFIRNYNTREFKQTSIGASFCPDSKLSHYDRLLRSTGIKSQWDL